jgi:hypothetical protein
MTYVKCDKGTISPKCQRVNLLATRECGWKRHSNSFGHRSIKHLALNCEAILTGIGAFDSSDSTSSDTIFSTREAARKEEYDCPRIDNVKSASVP